MEIVATPGRPRLVGREDELRTLATWLRRGMDREPATVVVGGDAGIGKTALVGAFLAACGDDVLVLRGACHELGGAALPWTPLLAIVRQLVRELGVGRVLELAGSAHPELARLVPVLPGEPEAADAGTGPALLISAITSLVRGAAGRSPVVLVMEDLHWADPSTLGVLPALVHALDDRPALVVVTMRWDELPDGAPARRLAAELVRGGGGFLLELDGLTRDEQARQLTGILGEEPTPSRLDGVWARAAGNPFFAEQLVLHHGVDLPATVNELLVGRLLDLPRATRRMLTTAAVAGGALEPDVLEAVLDVDGSKLTEMLEPAVQAHVLVPDDDGRLAFAHALLAEVAERMLLPTEAVAVHEGIADALASGQGSHAATERTSALARHRVAAGDPRRALPASVAAARQAVAVLAHPEAHHHYEDVLALWDRVDDASVVVGTDHAAMLREAAEVAHSAGRFRRAAELAREALGELDADADPEAAGLVCERLGRYLWMAGDGRAALSSYERAMDLVPGTPSGTRARVLSGQSQALVVAGDFARGLELAERAVAMAREVGARDVEVHALNNRGVARSHLGEVDAGLVDLDEAGHLAEQLGEDVDAVLRVIVNRTTALLDAGMLHDAAAFGLDHLKGAWSRCETAQALLELGRLDRAGELVAEAREYRPSGIEAAVVLAVEGRLQRLRGRLDRAEKLLESAADAARDAVDGHLLGRVGTDRVRLCLDRGQPEAALDRAVEEWSRLPHLAAAHAAPLAAAAVAASVDPGLGGGGQRDAERWHGRCVAVVRGSSGASPVAQAWLATAGAEHDRLTAGDAVAWGPVIEAWDRLGARPEAARSRWRMAGVILDRGGDRAEAAGLLRAAHVMASDMGLERLGSQVLDLARRARLDVAGGSGGSGDAPSGLLTPREQDVLELVVEGHTNREIADRLFIGHRTVATHVSNTLAKLGASTRSEATAIALREGLVD